MYEADMYIKGSVLYNEWAFYSTIGQFMAVSSIILVVFLYQPKSKSEVLFCDWSVCLSYMS